VSFPSLITNRALKIRLLAVVVALFIIYGCFWLYPEKFKTWNLYITDRLTTWQPRIHSSFAPYASPVRLIDAIFYSTRSHHARLIRNLAAMKTSVLVIDFIFAEKVDSVEDDELIRATAEAGNVYFGMSFGSLPGPFTSDGIAPKPEAIAYLDATKWRLKVDGDPGKLVAGNSPDITYAELSSVSKGLGFINMSPDADGILRRVPLLVRYRGGYYPSLPFRVVCDYLNVSPEQIIVKPGKAVILKRARTGSAAPTVDIVIPTDERGNMILNAASFHTASKRYSYSQIFQASDQLSRMAALQKELARKIVILSETVEKPFKVRFGSREILLPLVAVETAVIRNILTRSFLKPISNVAMRLIEIGLLAGLFFLSMRFSSTPLTVGALSVSSAYVLISVSFFLFTGMMFQFVQPLFLLFWGLIALLVGMGIENAMIFAETEKARRVAERELEIGREIQSGFFPTTLPEVPGWDLEIFFQAARHVAGDFYDVFTLGRKRRIGIVIADVCDKGVGAALFMALLRSFIRVLSGKAATENHLDGDAAPAVILDSTIRAVNDYISITHERAGMFATLFYGILDPDTGQVDYINCGHEPPVIIGQDGMRSWLPPTGPAVGIYPNLDHRAAHARLNRGDMLLVLTDGVTDARDRNDRSFAKKGLEDILKNPFSSAKELIARIKDRMNDYIADAEQFDDITVLALQRKRE
jgi:serine phosphatase RsbU (regulator of sigma subunit)/CHASE2 domain-containing sensor protein